MKINKKKLVNLMIDSNMNNNRLSKASGVSLSRVSLIKNGHNTTYETICKIASALGASANELIEDDISENIITAEVRHHILAKDDIKDVDPEDDVFVAAAESLKQTIALVKEDQERFIFEAITPFLTDISEIVIPKRVLERALFTFREEHTAEWKALMKEYGGTLV